VTAAVARKPMGTEHFLRRQRLRPPPRRSERGGVLVQQRLVERTYDYPIPRLVCQRVLNGTEVTDVFRGFEPSSASIPATKVSLL